MHDRGEGIASRDIYVGAIGYVLNNLTEIDQIRRIDDASRSGGGYRSGGGSTDGSR